MTSTPKQFENVGIDTKANIYFDGKVVSHTVHDRNGKKFTLGLILPGTYRFSTGAPEKMVITEGACRVLQASGVMTSHAKGTEFYVPGNSFFTITVENSPCEYACFFE